MDPNRTRGMGGAYGNDYRGPPLGAGRGRRRGHGEASGRSDRGGRDQGGHGYRSIDDLFYREYGSQPGEADEPVQFGGYYGRNRSAQADYHTDRRDPSRELERSNQGPRPQANHSPSELARGRVRRTSRERARLYREWEEKYLDEDGGYLIGDPVPRDFGPERTAEDDARYERRMDEHEKYFKEHERYYTPGDEHKTQEEFDAEDAMREN